MNSSASGVLSVFLGPEQEKCSEHPKYQIRHEAERGKVDVELTIVRSEREDLE